MQVAAAAEAAAAVVAEHRLQLAAGLVGAQRHATPTPDEREATASLAQLVSWPPSSCTLPPDIQGKLGDDCNLEPADGAASSNMWCEDVACGAALLECRGPGLRAQHVPGSRQSVVLANSAVLHDAGLRRQGRCRACAGGPAPQLGLGHQRLPQRAAHPGAPPPRPPRERGRRQRGERRLNIIPTKRSDAVLWHTC